MFMIPELSVSIKEGCFTITAENVPEKILKLPDYSARVNMVECVFILNNY